MNTTLLVKTKGILAGDNLDLIEKGTLLIDGDRIKDLGEINGTVGGDCEVLDLGSYYVMPGFVDAHSHITIRPGEGDQLGQLRQPAVRQALRGIKNLQGDLASGVTTMRVLAEENFLDVEFKSAIEKGEIYGPRLRIATRGLTASNGHAMINRGFDGCDEIRKAVRENIAAGADVIKLFITGGVSSPAGGLDAYTYTEEEVAVAVEEAHRAGKTVAIHAHGGPGVDICIKAGVDSIEHGAYLTENNINNMAEQKTWLVSTAAILFHPSGIEKGDRGNPAIWEKMLAARKSAENSFRNAVEAGLNIAFGTDSMHGLFPFEVEWAAEHGLGNKRALQAATVEAARLLQLNNQAGSLKKGYFADFLAFKENPLDNIKTLYDAAWVVKNGFVCKAEGKVVFE